MVYFISLCIPFVILQLLVYWGSYFEHVLIYFALVAGISPTDPVKLGQGNLKRKTSKTKFEILTESRREKHVLICIVFLEMTCIVLCQLVISIYWVVESLELLLTLCKLLIISSNRKYTKSLITVCKKLWMHKDLFPFVLWICFLFIVEK